MNGDLHSLLHLSAEDRVAAYRRARGRRVHAGHAIEMTAILVAIVGGTVGFFAAFGISL